MTIQVARIGIVHPIIHVASIASPFTQDKKYYEPMGQKMIVGSILDKGFVWLRISFDFLF